MNYGKHFAIPTYTFRWLTAPQQLTTPKNNTAIAIAAAAVYYTRKVTHTLGSPDTSLLAEHSTEGVLLFVRPGLGLG